MADTRISDLPALAGTDLTGTDVLPVADLSASETKKLTAKDLVQNGVGLIDDGTIPGAKLVADSVTAAQLAPDSVTDSELADNAVDTAAIADAAVTNSKIAAGVDGAKLTDDTVTAAKIPAASLDRGIDKTTGAIGHTNAVTAGTSAGITFDAQGHITGTTALGPADLPIATDSTIGGVSVPAASGLTVTAAGALGHDSAITPATLSGVTVNATGHVTGLVALQGADLPAATPTVKGGVSVPGPGLQVSGAGALTHSDSGVAAGIYQSVTVNALGHVTAGGGLSAAMVPGLDASKITTGTFDPARIGDDSLTNLKFADYATVLIQEGEPAGTDFYRGQFWYRESDAQLRTWSGNSWIPVGFGRLSEENLRFCGTFDASTGQVVQITPLGATAGIAAGAAIPAATNPLTGAYLVCAVPGTYAGVVYDAGDWVLCLGQAEGWVRIDTLSGGGSSTLNLGDLLDVTITTAANGDTLIYDSASNKWVNKPTAAVKATLQEAIDGTRTSFTLTKNADSVNQLLISIGGIMQNPGVDFTFTAPSTVNFSTAPPAGSSHWVLIEGVVGSGGGGGGTTLPDGTAAEEYLQWNATLGSWQPSTTLNGGSF